MYWTYYVNMLESQCVNIYSRRDRNNHSAVSVLKNLFRQISFRCILFYCSVIQPTWNTLGKLPRISKMPLQGNGMAAIPKTTLVSERAQKLDWIQKSLHLFGKYWQKLKCVNKKPSNLSQLKDNNSVKLNLVSNSPFNHYSTTKTPIKYSRLTVWPIL